MAVAAEPLARVGARMPDGGQPAPALPAPPHRRGQGAVYARRRALTVLGVGVALWAGTWLVGAAAQGVAAPLVSGAAEASVESAADAPTVVVGPGETVWSIARAQAPAGVSTAEYAAQIAWANGLDARELAPGAVLRLPVP